MIGSHRLFSVLSSKEFERQAIPCCDMTGPRTESPSRKSHPKMSKSTSPFVSGGCCMRVPLKMKVIQVVTNAIKLNLRSGVCKAEMLVIDKLMRGTTPFMKSLLIWKLAICKFPSLQIDYTVKKLFMIMFIHCKVKSCNRLLWNLQDKRCMINTTRILQTVNN